MNDGSPLSSHRLRVGDCVALKASPTGLACVHRIGTGNVQVVWFDTDGELHEDDLPRSGLVAVPPWEERMAQLRFEQLRTVRKRMSRR